MSKAPSLHALPLGLLQRMAEDLQETLRDARLQKIRHRDHGDLVFEFYTERGRQWLRMAALKNGSRLYLLKDKPEASGKDADAFCRTIRERLVPSLLRKVSILGDDRVLRFDFETPEQKFSLIFEAFGRRANLLLLHEEARILSCVHGKVLNRDIGPGKEYFPPEISSANVKALPPHLEELSGSSLHEYLEALWDSGDQEQASNQRQEQAAKVLRKDLKKLKRQEKSLEQDIAKAGVPEEHRAMGHLLAANLHQLKRGMTDIELVNPGLEGLPDKVSVKLDPKKSPEENMNRYYRQSKRAQGTRVHGERRLKELESRILELEEKIASVEAGDSDLIESLVPEDSRPQAKKSKGPAQRTGVSRYAFVHEIDKGTTIWVGRNAKSNDEILRQYARGNDLWFHARDGAGSHVFLRTEGRNPSPEEIRKAAQLAAVHSSLKKDTLVDVLWTHCKHITKRKGAPAGSVQVANGKTIRVATR